jgi:WhiB family transcriptional regulator, redox-sensing transcriptional regulator
VTAPKTSALPVSAPSCAPGSVAPAPRQGAAQPGPVVPSAGPGLTSVRRASEVGGARLTDHPSGPPAGESEPGGPDCHLTAPQLADEAGITYRMLDWWTRAAYLRAEGGDGSGRPRMYPAEEVAVARRMAGLVSAGLRPAAAELIARDGWPGGQAPGSSLHPAMSTGGWQDLARCRETDAEIFFPEKGGSPRAARRICASCEVREPCLEYALERDERFGIFGGLTTRQRDRLAAQRQRNGAA